MTTDHPPEENSLSSILLSLEERMESDPSFDLGAFMQQYPEYNQEIRAHVSDWGLFTCVMPQGATISNYEIIRILDRGGMGIVYLAQQQNPLREVALKMVLRTESNLRVSLFLNEVQSVARLDHPGIAPIYEAGTYQHQPFYVMPYIEGENLRSLVNRIGPLPTENGIKLLSLLVQSVKYAHGRDIIHRDINPRNVMVTKNAVEKLEYSLISKSSNFIPGDTRLLDFGLAGLRNSIAGPAGGTKGYMAPEQSQGSVSERVDVFGLGSTFYFILTGREPEYSSIRQSQVLVWPKGLTVHKNARAICGKCLELDPNKRYANAASLLEDLQRLSEGKPVDARKITVLEQAWLWSRRNKALAMALVTSASLALVFTLFLYWQNSQLRMAVSLGERFMQGVKDRRYRTFDDLLAESLETNEPISDAQRQAATLTMLALSNLVEVNKMVSAIPRNRLSLAQQTWGKATILLAKQRLNSAIQSAPNYGPAFLLRGLLRREYLEEKAIDVLMDYQKAAELVPTASVSFSGRGWCYKEMGQVEQAISDFQSALAIDPCNQFAYLGLARIHSDKEDTIIAAEYFEKAADNHLRFKLFPSWYANIQSEVCISQWVASNNAFEREDFYTSFYYGMKALKFSTPEYQTAILKNLLILAKKITKSQSAPAKDIVLAHLEDIEEETVTGPLRRILQILDSE
jgi:serine/threonine protein kinase